MRRGDMDVSVPPRNSYEWLMFVIFSSKGEEVGVEHLMGGGVNAPSFPFDALTG